MSYSCSISFKSVEGSDVFEFLQQFKEFCLKKENYEAIAKENCHYCPINRGIESYEKLKDVPSELIEQSKNWVVNGVFKFRYFYDKDRKQVGVYGVPTVAQKMFDGTVYFQNSCDQDYEKSEYEGIKVFEDIYDDWFSLSEEEFIKRFEKEFNQKFDRDYIDDNKDNEQHYKEALDYTKRSIIYDIIWKPIAHTLENDETALHLSFFGYYDTLRLYSFISSCHKEHLEWEKEFEKKYSQKQEKDDDSKLQKESQDLDDDER